MSVIIIYLKKLEKNLMLKGKNNTISATKANTLTMLIKQSFQTHINPYNMQETDYIKTVTYKE